MVAQISRYTSLHAMRGEAEEDFFKRVADAAQNNLVLATLGGISFGVKPGQSAKDIECAYYAAKKALEKKQQEERDENAIKALVRRVLPRSATIKPGENGMFTLTLSPRSPLTIEALEIDLRTRLASHSIGVDVQGNNSIVVNTGSNAPATRVFLSMSSGRAL